jgi:hypothetical protein
VSGFPRNVTVLLDEAEALSLANWLGGLKSDEPYKAAALSAMRDELTPKKPRTYPRRFLLPAGGAALLSRWCEEWDHQQRRKNSVGRNHLHGLFGPALQPTAATLLTSSRSEPLWYPVPPIERVPFGPVRKVVAAFWSRAGRKRLTIDEKKERLSAGFGMIAERRKADYARDIAFHEELEAWSRRVAARGETRLTSSEPPPTRKRAAAVRKPHKD